MVGNKYKGVWRSNCPKEIWYRLVRFDWVDGEWSCGSNFIDVNLIVVLAQNSESQLNVIDSREA